MGMGRECFNTRRTCSRSTLERMQWLRKLCSLPFGVGNHWASNCFFLLLASTLPHSQTPGHAGHFCVAVEIRFSYIPFQRANRINEQMVSICSSNAALFPNSAQVRPRRMTFRSLSLSVRCCFADLGKAHIKCLW